MVKRKKTKEIIAEDSRALPDGFVSIGKRKPFLSSGTTGSVALTIPKHILEENKWKEGDVVTLCKNGQNDLLVVFNRE